MRSGASRRVPSSAMSAHEVGRESASLALGCGLFAVLDYYGNDFTHDDFVHMAGITAPSGIGFDEVVLDQATANVVDECVPDHQPGPD